MKIDLDQFVCSLLTQANGKPGFKFRMSNVLEALAEQGLDFDGKDIVEKYRLRGIITGKPSPAVKEVVDSLTPEIMEEAKQELEYNAFDDFRHSDEETENSKFKVGDWVVYLDYLALLIKGVREESYVLDSITNGVETLPKKYVEDNFYPWTIQDAKDGDVLVDSLGNVCIYQEPSTKLMYHSYCYGNHKCFIDMGGSHGIVGSYPATKEQRDLLFQKMKEAGYEWDAEKKELKKIEQPKLTEFEDAIKDMIDDYRDAIGDNAATVEEVKEHAAYLLSLIPQKPAEWSKEDDYNLQYMIAKVTSDIQKGNVGRNQELIDWLKTFKDRVQPQQIQEWSEEDVLAIKRIIDTIQCAQLTRNGKPRALYTDEILDNLVNWLKSLKNRVQPKQEWNGTEIAPPIDSDVCG